MDIEPQSAPGLEPAPTPPPIVAETKKLLAPVWHTVLIVVLVLLNSYFTAGAVSRLVSQGGKSVTVKMQMVQYGSSIILEFFLLFLVWIGLRLEKTTIREVIGGRWKSPEDFLLDIAIAAGFWAISIGVLYGGARLMGMASPTQMEEARKLLGVIAPRTAGTLAIFVCLSAVAGFVEEIIFRGYLQQQIGAIAGNIYVGLVVSALVFGGGHGYEGTRRMVLIFIYGAMFGLLALWRKSLRPGMMAHAWHDAFTGVFLFIAAHKGFMPMH